MILTSFSLKIVSVYHSHVAGWTPCPQIWKLGGLWGGQEEEGACPLVSSTGFIPAHLTACPHALPAPLFTAFLSHGEEADVYLGKAGESGQGPTLLGWAGAGPALVRGLWA